MAFLPPSTFHVNDIHLETMYSPRDMGDYLVLKCNLHDAEYSRKFFMPLFRSDVRDIAEWATGTVHTFYRETMRPDDSKEKHKLLEAITRMIYKPPVFYPTCHPTPHPKPTLEPDLQSALHLADK